MKKVKVHLKDEVRRTLSMADAECKRFRDDAASFHVNGTPTEGHYIVYAGGQRMNYVVKFADLVTFVEEGDTAV